MQRESETEFHQRWVKSAEADVESARRAANRDRVICLILMIPTLGYCLLQTIAPGGIWANRIYWLLGIPFLISLMRAGISLSNMRDAEKFLEECRQDLANHGSPRTEVPAARNRGSVPNSFRTKETH